MEGASMMKKLIVVVMILAMGVAALTGCQNKQENGGAGTSNTGEYIGKFSGSAGFMEFAANGEVKIDFSDEHVWDLYPPSFNKTHKYQFVDQEKEAVSYEQAAYLNLLELKNGKYFYTLPCKAEEGKITLFPEEDFEAVFYRKTE